MVAIDKEHVDFRRIRLLLLRHPVKPFIVRHARPRLPHMFQQNPTKSDEIRVIRAGPDLDDTREIIEVLSSPFMELLHVPCVPEFAREEIWDFEVFEGFYAGEVIEEGVLWLC